MVDAFETFAAMAHIALGFLAGYGYASRGKKRWIPWTLVLLLTIIEGVRFYYMGPS